MNTAKWKTTHGVKPFLTVEGYLTHCSTVYHIRFCFTALKTLSNAKAPIKVSLNILYSNLFLCQFYRNRKTDLL